MDRSSRSQANDTVKVLPGPFIHVEVKRDCKTFNVIFYQSESTQCFPSPPKEYRVQCRCVRPNSEIFTDWSSEFQLPALNLPMLMQLKYFRYSKIEVKVKILFLNGNESSFVVAGLTHNPHSFTPDIVRFSQERAVKIQSQHAEICKVNADDPPAAGLPRDVPNPAPAAGPRDVPIEMQIARLMAPDPAPAAGPRDVLMAPDPATPDSDGLRKPGSAPRLWLPDAIEMMLQIQDGI